MATLAHVARKANNALRDLLRTPKTRNSLTACLKSLNLDRKFVEGWLIERCRAGEVIKIDDAGRVLYQLSECAHDIVLTRSVYPAWLEPRELPTATSRNVYIGGPASLATRRAMQLEEQAQ